MNRMVRKPSTTIIPSSKLGDDWHAKKHAEVMLTFGDLETLADLRRKRIRLIKAVNRLHNEEKEILRKYLDKI